VIITFLGTGTSQGIPVIGCQCKVCQSLDFRDKRLRTSAHVMVDGVSLVIDTGPDFRQQMLREHITQLDAVLYTHEHKDHTAGMDDIRSFNFLQKKDIPLYARKQVLDQLKMEFSYVFSEMKYPGVPQVQVHGLENNTLEISGVKVIPIEVMHYKLPVFGFRVKDFVYITDANYISDAELNKMRGADALVINALHQTDHISHYNLQQALEIIAEVKPKNAYLTHMSHQMGSHASVSEKLPDNVQFAYDGLKLTL